MNKKRILGLGLGIAVAIIVGMAPLDNISYQGQVCLGLTLMTVIFWAFQIVQPGYSSGLYLALLIILGVAPPEIVLSAWIGSTMYLVIGAYLIASAVKSSGLGERIAYKFIIKYVSSYRSIIISIFILTAILSILIPHPWPRAFLIMSVMSVLIESANISKEDSINIGFTVFAATVPVSMIFLTGDSVINPLAAQASGYTISWIEWFIYMGPPSILASIITCILILILFKPSQEVVINKDKIRIKLESLGGLSDKEKRTIIWLLIAIILWLTDSVHGINIGWITLIISMLMAFPVVGDLLLLEHWAEVPVHVLLFLTAAMTIGRVGEVTGMNMWIAETLLPSHISSNIYILALVIGIISMGLHMVLGSVIAVMGIAIPSLLIVTKPMGVNPIITSLLVFTSISVHYILPFHHLNVLVGQGDTNGMYGQKEVMRLGIPLTGLVFILLIIEVLYWKLIGLL